ncbi:hypothetical protein MMC21_002243 [Puttea exsequens]|nr:hypothetical protein [Puttea exsequens]
MRLIIAADSQRASDKVSKPTYSREIAAGIEALCNTLELPEFSMTSTSWPHHRRLCLYSCGLGLPPEQVENKVKELISKGHYIKAAAFALIHDEAKLASSALKGGTASQTQRELLIALAGYNKGIADPAWDQTIQELRSTLENPYARAILALVSYGNWRDVLDETSLPLRDRVGIALIYLNDEELTQYINDTTAECVREGDIEGVVLTGLTEQAVNLFENYIHKSSDLQTAVLAMAFTCPRDFSDARVDMWHETYRSHLNDWRMFVPRVRFDVQSTTLSASPSHKPALPPPPRQVSLRCNNCDQALDRNTDNAPRAEQSTFFSGTHKGTIFGEAKDGTVCPRCDRHMPRCVVCMYWLGMPDPHSKGSQAAGPTKKDILDKFISVCRTCWHMCHGGHSEKWFAEHSICPVPDCDCRCAEMG